MADQVNYGQQLGHAIVAHAIRFPGTDVAWQTLPNFEAGAWMADAVETAALEMRVPQCGYSYALKGGA